MKNKVVRYAVVGLGHIAQVAVLPAFKNCCFSQVSALISGDPQKRKLLGNKYGVKYTYSYDDYEKCLNSGLIDAVYIALPNHLHKEFTIRAAAAGVHVLCEKPMAVTSQECIEMIQACKYKKIKFMVAYRLHFEAANLRAIDLIHRKKRVGDLRMFQSIHSQLNKSQNIRTLPTSLGGGPTFDIGIYDINAARYLFQAEPIFVSALAGQSPNRKFKDIEETMSVILKFPHERLASLVFSFGAVTLDEFKVVGTKGVLSLSPAYTYKGKKYLNIIGESYNKHLAFKERDQFSPEIDYFSKCIVKNKIPEPSGLEGLADICIIEAIHSSAHSGQVIPILPINKMMKPNLSQRIDRSPVKKPTEFHAEGPTEKKAA